MSYQKDGATGQTETEKKGKNETIERDSFKLYLSDLRYLQEKNGKNTSGKKRDAVSDRETRSGGAEASRRRTDRGGADERIDGLYERLYELRRLKPNAKREREIRRLSDGLYSYFLPIVVAIAQSYRQESGGFGSDELCELISAGNLALEEAIRSYGPHKKLPFRQYVLKTVRNEMRVYSRLLSLFRFVPVTLSSDAAELYRRYQLKKRMEKLCVELKAADGSFDSSTPFYYDTLAEYYRLRRWSDSFCAAWNAEAKPYAPEAFAVPDGEEDGFIDTMRRIETLLLTPEGPAVCGSKKSAPEAMRRLMGASPELRKKIPPGGLFSLSLLCRLMERKDDTPALLRDTFRLTRVESPETIADAMCGEFAPLSLDAPVTTDEEGEEVTLAEMVEDRDVDPIWTVLEAETARERRERILSLLGPLEEEDKQLVLFRCGLIKKPQAWDLLEKQYGAEGATAYADRLVCSVSDPHRQGRVSRLLDGMKDLGKLRADFGEEARICAEALRKGKTQKETDAELKSHGLAALSPAVYWQAIMLCCFAHNEAYRGKKRSGSSAGTAETPPYDPAQFVRLYHKVLKGQAFMRLEQTRCTALRDLSFAALRSLLLRRIFPPALPPWRADLPRGMFERTVIETVAASEGFYVDEPQARYYAALCVYEIMLAQLKGTIRLLRFCSARTVPEIARAVKNRIREPGAAGLVWQPEIRFAKKLTEYGDRIGRQQILTAISSSTVLCGKLGGSLSANGYLSGLSERLIPANGPSEKNFRSLDGSPITASEFVRQQCYQPTVFSELTADPNLLAELICRDLFCFDKQQTKAFAKKLTWVLKGEGIVDGKENLCCAVNRYELLLLYAAAHVLDLGARGVITNDVPFATNVAFADVMLAKCGFSTLSDDRSPFGGLIREILRCRTGREFFCVRYALAERAGRKTGFSLLPVCDEPVKRVGRVDSLIGAMKTVEENTE